MIWRPVYIPSQPAVEVCDSRRDGIRYCGDASGSSRDADMTCVPFLSENQVTPKAGPGRRITMRNHTKGHGMNSHDLERSARAQL